MSKILLIIYFLTSAFIVNSQTADFTYQTTSGLFCNPVTVQFVPTYTGSPTGFVWTFGRDTSSNALNPLITFSQPGTFAVKLIVIYARATVVVNKTILINPSITQSIGYDRNYICTPGAINFTASGTGNITTYDWNFGDGSGIQTTNANNIAHNYTALGVYKVTLKATDFSGCADTNTSSVYVQVPPIKTTVAPASGCIPANVRFTANDSIPLNSSVANYLWDFHDGSPVVSTITGNINHTYTAAGGYSPVVTITTSEGCTSSHTFGIAYGTPPFNQIAYAVKTVICGSETANFVSKATNANKYYYNFGDSTSTYVSDTTARHKFKTLGAKSVYILPLYNDCYSKPIIVNLNVVGVIAAFTYSNNCTDKKTFSFTNTSQGNLSSVTWDFGDGSPVVNTRNATHTFPSSDSFVTKLTVIDNITGCVDTFSRTIFTANPFLVNADTSICKNDSTTFSVANSYNNPLSTYTWLIAGKRIGPVKDSVIKISAALFGDFNNYVIINNGAQYCQDTVRLPNKILVRGPNLSYTALPNICLNDLYTVTNTSKPFVPADTVNTWYWNFGVDSLKDSVYQPQPYLYNNPGTYFAKLTGIDKNGCKDSLVKRIKVNPLPFLYVIPAGDTLCFGKADSLFAFHSDSVTWSPSNSLSCAGCDTVIANPSLTTQYIVTAASKAGCAVRDTILVKVFPPFVAVPPVSDFYICLNDTVQLNVNPPGKKILWSPATGLSTVNNYGPIASPDQTTTYTATLTDSVGCFTSTADINVHLKSQPTVDAGPDKIYPYYSNFTISPLYSTNISSYSWTPADPLSCTTCPNPSGIATSSNTFFIKVTSDSGCVAKDTITIFVECKDANLLMPNAFTPNNDGHNDYFYPLTRGIKSITRFSIYNRYGKLVYEARNFPPNDKTFGWNGRVNDMEQTTNVFVYYVEAICDLGQKLYKKGSVVLIK